MGLSLDRKKTNYIHPPSLGSILLLFAFLLVFLLVVIHGKHMLHDRCVMQQGPEVIKLFSCSAEYEISNAQLSIKILRKSAFLGSDMHRMLFFPAHKC